MRRKAPRVASFLLCRDLAFLGLVLERVVDSFTSILATATLSLVAGLFLWKPPREQFQRSTTSWLSWPRKEP